ncbi:MAG: hypothetical protein ACI8TQ_000871 [Planctomycetota bacterium]|jgi:hypothetical protein
MPESEWSEQQVDEPKKGIPVWVWGCGGCGLITLIVVLVLGGLAYSKITDAIDPEKVWPNVDQALAFDERPEGYTAMGGGLMEAEMYFIQSESKGTAAMLLMFENESGEQVDNLFSGEEFSGNQFGIGNFGDSIPATFNVDGRECDGLILRNAELNLPMANSGGAQSDLMIALVDLSKDANKLRIIEVFSMNGDYSVDEDDEATTIENAQRLVGDFLKPFTPWN